MRILISAGPTREYFDSVRFISNPSSGKMGYALARAAVQRGHEVTLVSGPVNLKPPEKVKFIAVTSAAEMAEACKKAWRRSDVGIMTAAVCDYRPQVRLDQKLAKKAQTRRVSLEPTEDIAAALGSSKGKRLLVGFAMEDHDPHAHAERKLKKKNCDLIVLNGLRNVGSADAVVEFLHVDSDWSEPIIGSKLQVARRIVREIEAMQASR